MGQCFVPDCNHQSEREVCRFYRFPKDPQVKRKWLRQIRREDKEPTSSSRVCACHFRDGKKKGGPEIFKRNVDKIFPLTPAPKKKATKTKQLSTADACTTAIGIEPATRTDPGPSETNRLKVDNVILKVQLEETSKELKDLQTTAGYRREKYSIESLTDEVVCMETGLPNKKILEIVTGYLQRFEDNIEYFSGWRVKAISFQDQIFITLMKLRQNYTNLHLSQLFHTSTATIRNVVITFLHILFDLLYEDTMKTVPSREKNKLSMPDAFQLFGSCRMVIDCTDVEIAAPKLMSDQKRTYSSYRGMHSFKLLLGVAPNAVITYCSNLFPGSVSDKAVVKECDILTHFKAGDLILADKGFLIQDIVPPGVAINIPPFLSNGKFSESEVKITKNIAKCRIHVERANARLKDFRILTFIPPYLRCYTEKIVKVCCSLVNLQHSLIREIRDTADNE
ncbi:putative nuclease HARBI1 [Strongylocentrotus purpuratus]|uniref:THAP-type domain-containing protein n=1 Tax=Strongylocentrotus purpuratus TaxID=7668 RepID=A0A7M7HEC8_STRPU|nr:putative nuclease HARBI1 [Strongylocentrotus purpuratus]|eukprot:XP_011661157.1 PREDICTED: putative nuclease HARBI1 [Strongylocentrotus purpuratus]